jgi:hypothetical protein
MSFRCGILGWHSFELVARSGDNGDALECRRCRHRLRLRPARRIKPLKDELPETV